MDSLLGEFRATMRSIARTLIYHVPRECQRCPSCGSPRIYELDVLPRRGRPSESGRVGFVSGCDECGLVFSNPQPTPQELKRFYSPTGAWGLPRIGGARKAGEPAKRARGRSWSKVFGPIRETVIVPPACAKALDFGCGAGDMLDALQECGWDTSGIDTAVDYAFPRHHRLDAVPDEPVFDLIVANHVLEHVTDPLGLLRRFARAAHMGGYLLIGVPRFETLPIHRDYKYVINGRAHVTAFTWPCLQGLLARAGWKAVAPPPDRISKGRKGQTYAQMRVVAQRVEEYVERVPSPSDAARRAIRRYHADVEGRMFYQRLGLYRLAARGLDARRRHTVRIRKAEKATGGVS